MANIKNEKIDIINYLNPHKNLDFEIRKIEDFYMKSSKRKLESIYRLNFWVILYIIDGEGSHFIDFKKYHYSKGDVIFIRKNQVQHFCVNNNVKGYVMHINEPFLYKTEVLNSDIFFEFLNKTFATPIISVDNSITSSNRSLIELMYIEYEKENAVNLELIASLFQSFILSLRDIKLPNDKVLLTKDFYNFTVFNELLEKNYSTIRNVDRYAVMMNLSKKTINKATRTVTGLSAKQYIIDRVILEIKRYLSQGDLLNYEIANLLNFDEAANMTKFFKKYVGISPKQFREEN